MAAGAKSQGSSPLRSLVRGLGLLGPYYRLTELRRAMTYPKPPALAPDGKPLPNRLAMMRIGGVSDWKFFYERGRKTAEVLVAAAREAGSDPAKWARVLDWGCGCGRIARHMPELTPARIIGRDIDAYTVKWCARHLEGDFKLSALQPPLDVAPGSIDFAYGFSVLTHLTAPMQARCGGFAGSTHSSQARFIASLLGIWAIYTVAERISDLCEPASARFWSIRASALRVCS